MDVPETLIASRSILRRARASDTASIFSEYAHDPEVTRYLTWRPNTDIHQTEEFLAGCIQRWQAGTEYSWTITLTGDDRAVGMIAARVHGHAADIGYVLARRLWGQGIMTEAATAVVDWLGQEPSIFRIWAVCDTANPASAKVMHKAGLQPEGVLRRWIIHPNISNEPRDCFVYARVK